MKYSATLIALCSIVTLISARRETRAEAAIHARELIKYRAYNTGTLISTYKENTSPSNEFIGLPIGLQELYALHPDQSGDLILLAMPISTIYRNAMKPNSPNLTITIDDKFGFGNGILAAGRYRLALFGTLTPIPSSDIPSAKLAYLSAHPDARGWIPPNGPHTSYFVRFKVEKIFAFDGFGNVAYIGWIPLDEYRDAGRMIRSEEEVKSDWPVPEQPEEEEDVGEMWFSESIEEEKVEERLRIQL